MAFNTTNLTARNVMQFYDIGHRVKLMLQSPHDMIAIMIGLIAIIVSILVLVALYQVKLQLTTHHRLIISLAVSDMAVGGSVMLHIINKLLNPVYKVTPGSTLYQTERKISACMYMSIKALNSTGLNSTLFNLMLMAIDHHVAVFAPLHYHHLMNKHKVNIVVMLFWCVAIVLGYSDFISAVHIYHKNIEYGYNYCEIVRLTKYQEEFAILVVAPVCLGVMFFIYGRIYLKIRRHRRPGYTLSDSRAAMGRKTTKALVTTLLNICTFLVTWIPMCLFQGIMLIQVNYKPQVVQKNWRMLLEVDKYLFDLLMFNAIADSIIYAVRVKEVQSGLIRLKDKVCCRYCVLRRGSSRRSVASISTSFMRVKSVTSSQQMVEMHESAYLDTIGSSQRMNV